MKKPLIALGLLLLLFLGGIFTILSIGGRDIPSPDLSDLQVERHPVSDDDNAYPHFLLATDALDLSTNSDVLRDYRSDGLIDPTNAAELILLNQEMFEHLRQGVALNSCQSPEVKGYTDRLPYTRDWVEEATLLLLKSDQERISGDLSKATETCLVLLRFGDMTQHNPESLIQYIIGSAILDYGCMATDRLARDRRLTRQDLARLTSAAQDLHPPTLGLTRSIKTEFRFAGMIIDDIAAGKVRMDLREIFSGHEPNLAEHGMPVPKYMFLPNKTKQGLATLYRDAITNASRPYADVALLDPTLAITIPRGGILDSIRPNSMGRQLYNWIVISFDQAIKRACRIRCQVAATRLILALRAHRDAREAFPKTLDALVPEYLTSVPADPFDGKPFRYNPTNRVIYSVGEDLINSGGSQTLRPGASTNNLGWERWGAQDAVFEIGIIEEAKQAD